MIRRYDVDDLAQREALLRRTPTVEALPRRTVYGKAPRLMPVGDYPDLLVKPADYKEVIARCHADQVFSLYHQRATWGSPGVRWNQNGLGYCWTWSGTAALMDLFAREGREVKLLSPVTMGWLVNWKDEGNYLESMIEGLMTRGVAEMRFTPDQHSRKYKQYLPGWEENALENRLGEVFDADPDNMIQHALTILNTGSSGYIAYNWWGHALELVGLRWDETQRNNLVWVIRNSHDEDDVIEMTGARAVPDELYGFRASLTA